jgi:hypothetical protein
MLDETFNEISSKGTISPDIGFHVM